MKMFVEPTAIYLHREFVDFRKAINGLAVIVEQQMQLSPLSGALFIFCNKSRDKLKILYWDNTGFALWQKRLDKAKFKWPSTVNSPQMTLSEQQLNALLGGFDIIGHQRLNYQSVAL
ncbi:IS66 family insertion sequence element accessory protein TnpB [Thalassomonas haliotis]|uniref:IS66 family insertion sequence element accessory protein TnpB n=1 Tax=Thalassomonas haliotis TaxID=485448 RepID=A0ABY7VDV0_9GAMM|nr:IS66 family insertion sequence element accessory protein TnpB [Thalassomonas haliotis]WDE11855.1 IS66 family insertion sequence element accessory protein TnpB [Thalassomonas haliotis]